MFVALSLAATVLSVANPAVAHPAAASPASAVAVPSPATAAAPAPQSSGTQPVAWRRELKQFGFTWTFRRNYKTGQFANGDWWVVGPVEIIDITPRTADAGGGRIVNGSMVNPSPLDGTTQGYDSAMYGSYAKPGSFDLSMNVAWPLTQGQSIILEPGSSLISTQSDPVPGARPQLESAAILTVLDTRPPDGSFRPPYCGEDKEPKFRLRMIDTTRLSDLEPVQRAAPIRKMERALERPWLDHVPSWISTYIHPHENMPNYGRDMANVVGAASLILNLNSTAKQKQVLGTRLIQLGIDFHGILKDGGAQNWQAGGGHHSGRKWPILFAGVMLGDPEMSSIGLDPNLLFMGEDGQTFYVQETSPGVYNYGYGGYTAAEVGMAEWGTTHALNPRKDNADWYGDPYRICCTANSWTGIVLSARVMGLVDLWNHPPLFDYQDRFMQIQRQQGGSMATSFFTLEMWDTYRANY